MINEQYGGKNIDDIMKDHPRYYNTPSNFEVFIQTLNVNDFIIVGGGPVGLQTVVEMSKLLSSVTNRHRKICIIENRSLNTRRQIIFIEDRFWINIPHAIKKYIHDNNGLCITKRDVMLNCYNQEDNYDNTDNRSSYARIDILQDAYYAYLKGLENVHVCVLNSLEAARTIDLIMTTPVINIILSDGGGPKSISKFLFEDTNFIQVKVSHVVVLGFDCNIKGGSHEKYSRHLDRHFPNVPTDQRQLLTFFTRSKDDPNMGSGYIGLQICHSSYDNIKTVNNITSSAYKKCQDIPNARFERLRDIAKKIQTTNSDCYNIAETTKPAETRSFPEFALINHALNLFDDVRITAVEVFELKLGTAKQFYKRIGDKFFYLIGDSAYKTHFFTGTGLNRGFASSKILLDLLLNPNFNRELLAISFNMAQTNMRNILWKEQIPKYMFDLCRLHQYGSLTARDLDNDEAVTQASNEFFTHSKSLLNSQDSVTKIWNGDNPTKEYYNLINKLIENEGQHKQLLTLILGSEVLDDCTLPKCTDTHSDVTKLTELLDNFDLKLSSAKSESDFTIYAKPGGNRRRLSKIRKLKRKQSKYNK